MTAGARGKYKRYEIKLKLEFCQKARSLNSIAKAQREMKLDHVHHSTLSGWLKKEGQLADESTNFNRKKKANKCRIGGGGRKPALGQHEIEVYNEIMDIRNLKIRVTRLRVFKIALEVAAKYNIPEFKATSRWISGFFKRFRLSLRRQSSLQTLTDDEIIKRSVKFMRYLSHTFSSVGYFDCKDIVAMDETAVYFASSQSTTVDVTNASSVIAKGTGFESDRITCILAIKPDGTFIKPLLLLKGKEDGVMEEYNNVFVTKTNKAWITVNSCLLWLKMAFKSTFFGGNSNTKFDKMLIWDACPVQSRRSKKAFKK